MSPDGEQSVVIKVSLLFETWWLCKIILVQASSWLLVKDSSIDVDKREIEMHLFFSEIIILLVGNIVNSFALCVSM